MLLFQKLKIKIKYNYLVDGGGCGGCGGFFKFYKKINLQK